MATVVPPPSKRQKTEALEKTQSLQEADTIPSGLGNIRLQFNDQSSGQAVGAPIQVPVEDATLRNLELLLNTLQGNVCISLLPL